MIFLKLSYRQVLSSLLLLGYLMGNFSLPIFEGLHFVWHLGDEAPLHSFQTHTGQHQHVVLDVLDDLVTNSTSDYPIDNSSKKDNKKVQQLVVDSLISLIAPTQYTSCFFTLRKVYDEPFPQATSPPPKMIV